MTRIPNFLIIGAEKSGTTWLYNKLSAHDQVYLPLTKECHFFNQYYSNLEINKNYEKLGWDWYARFFEDVPKLVTAVGEATPMYLCDPLAPERIAHDIPDVKLIYILRNPVERAYSHYWMAYRKGHVDKSFEQIVREKNKIFIGRGKYSKQLELYYNLFPKNNIKGFVYDHFFDKPKQGLNQVQEFLDIKKYDYQDDSIKEKILASPKPKSKLLHKLIGQTARKLRENELTFAMLDWLKSAGIAPMIKKWNTNSEVYPEIDKSVYEELVDYYIDDINRLKSDYGLNVDCWLNYNTQSIN